MVEGEQEFYPDQPIEDASSGPSLAGSWVAWLAYWLGRCSEEELMECFEADQRFSDWVQGQEGREEWGRNLSGWG